MASGVQIKKQTTKGQKMRKIVFKFDNAPEVEAFANDGEILLEVAKKANVVIDAPCSGNVSCGKCIVKIISGDVESQLTRHITEQEYRTGYRLACNSKINGDVTVYVPDIASAFKKKMKISDLSSPEEVAIFTKSQDRVAAAGIEFKNDFQVLDITMDVPSLDDTMPDNERLIRAIEAEIGTDKIRISYGVVRKLPLVLRENDFHVKVVISKESADLYVVNDVLPADKFAHVAGLAIDIGTTTVSAVLFDMLSGKFLARGAMGNGQIRYGADVINRIIESGKEGGSKKLQDAVIKETINPLIREMCASAGISRDFIYRMSIAGNTTMNHLFAGIYAEPIRMEPYIPEFFQTEPLRAKDVGVAVNPDANILMCPNIGSYVGGDITAGVLANTMWANPEMTLFVDLGTNGEIVFGNSDFLMSCACSAGPAFEGGDISCGMRAMDGAIESITIDKETLEPTYKVIGDEKPVGICGSGIIDIISELFRTEAITPKGKFARENKRIRYDEDGMGSYIVAFQEESGGIKEVEINEVDIDNFIRAKGAIFSGIRTLLMSLDFDVEMIDKLVVAGGIGSGINIENAINIGMFPKIPLDKYEYIGNSSLAGAYTTLMSNQGEEKLAEIGSSMTYIELSTTPGYMDEFVAACFLPHTDRSLFE